MFFALRFRQLLIVVSLAACSPERAPQGSAASSAIELTDDAVVGEPGQGWAVASRQLYHERRTMGDGSEFTSGPGITAAADIQIDLLSLIEKTGATGDPKIRAIAPPTRPFGR